MCRDDRNVWTLVGIVSFSIATKVDKDSIVYCSDASGYTEVSFYHEWIFHYL